MNVIELNNVSVDFAIYGAGSRSLKKSLLNISTGNRISRDARERVTVHALQEFSLTISEGERVGLTGVNGAGKSTLLRTIAGIYEPTSGHVRVNGSVTTLFSLNVGIEQEATGYENIVLRGLAAGMCRDEIEKQTDSIAEFSELGEYLNLPVHTYSAGMSARLAFAISTAIEPDILLMDEWIGAGDEKFIKKAQQRLDTLVNDARVLVLASHNKKMLSRVCTRIIEISDGRVARTIPVERFHVDESN